MYDVIIIGAGPAGANAALETSAHGLKTLLIDEQRDAGGQVWRVKSKSILKAPKTETSEKGDALREEIASSIVEVMFETRVWQIEKDDEENWILGIDSGNGGQTINCKSLIIATGAQERVIPVPGWTLPGVLGLAGATALFKEHMMVPGRRVIVAGNGPLLFFVASEVRKLGGKVSAVVSLNGRFDWFKSLPAMMANPSLIWQGVKWIFDLTKNRVPIYWGFGIKTIEGKDKVDGVTICKVDNDWRIVEGPERYIHGESVCYGHGLMPAIEATRLAGGEHHFDDALGGWVPTVDEFGRTSVKSLYTCGDNTGILGVGAAPLRGRFAAKAVLEDHGVNNVGNADFKQLKKARKFGLAATALTIPRVGFESFITGDTEVCRCEGITRNEIEYELKTGAVSPNAVKSGTRCGMGPCGGRYCAESLAIITEHVNKQSREQIGLPTSRPPLRPIAINDLSDDFNYDDLPIPGVSPL